MCVGHWLLDGRRRTGLGFGVVMRAIRTFRIGVMIGSAGLVLGTTAPKASAATIYDSGSYMITNSVATGSLIISYQQTIKEVDTDGNGTLEAIQSSVFV